MKIVDHETFAKVINELGKQGIEGVPITCTNMSVMQWSKDGKLIAQSVYHAGGMIRREIAE